MTATSSAGQSGPRAVLRTAAAKNVLSGLLVALGAFALFNAAFIGIALVAFAVQFLFPQLPLGPPGIIAGLSALAIVSWLLLRIPMRPALKAIVLTMPLAWSYVALGLLFWQTPIVTFVIGGAATLTILTYFIRAKKPWIYAYAVALVATALSLASVLGLEI